MSVWNLVVREMAHRRGSALSSLLLVVVAIGCLVGSQTLLRSDKLQTAEILAARRAEVEQAIEQRRREVEAAGLELQDAMRKTMKGLGFNVLILPESQDLAELHHTGTPTETMPESYVDKLANSKIVTINHLLPSVSKRVEWPERKMEVVLIGTRGEVPILHRSLKKPLLDAVPPGTMVVGYHVHRKLNIQAGDRVTFMGQEFEVTKVHPERGSIDDVSVWIDLRQAQELLGMQNLIHAILALECDCAGDRITQIRQEIAQILPGTQVIERGSKALARAEARAKARSAAEEALRAEEKAGAELLRKEEAARSRIERQHAQLASILVPLVLAVCGVWIAYLSFANVRQRRAEIGILRAIGLRSGQILLLFLGKAVAVGLLGGVLGFVVGFGVSAGMTSGWSNPAAVAQQLYSAGDLILALVMAPLLSGLAGWLPALAASREDPAVILQAE